MVKKASLFERLAERFRSGSVRVESAEAGSDGIARVEPMPMEPESRPVRKLSEREEALLAMNENFGELTSALRQMHQGMDSQLSRLVESASAMQQLPPLSTEQLTLLRAMETQLVRQNELGQQIAGTLQVLPPLLQNVEAALQRAAQSDERAMLAMREFQHTMDRVQNAMGEMVRHSETQAQATQELAARRDENLGELKASIEGVQREAAESMRSSTQSAMQSLRDSNEDQSTRLQRSIESNTAWNKAVLTSFFVVVLGAIAVAVALSLK
jgi:hypothetical protein